MARLRCFQHHLSENNVFFLFSLPNYPCKLRCFQFDGTKNMFFLFLLATKLGCFELYVACSLLKYGVLSFIAPKTCFALFAVKLGIFQHYCSGKWISFPIFNEWRWFLLDGTQKNVLACFWLSYAVLSIIFLRTTFTTFSYMKYVFDALTYQNIFWFVCSEFELVWALCHKRERFSFSVFKISCFKLYCSKNMFWFLCRRIALFLAILHGEMVSC